MQKQDVKFSEVISLLHSLHLFTSELRDEFPSFELKAEAIATDAKYADTTCRKRKGSVLLSLPFRVLHLMLCSLVGKS